MKLVPTFRVLLTHICKGALENIKKICRDNKEGKGHSSSTFCFFYLQPRKKSVTLIFLFPGS